MITRYKLTFSRNTLTLSSETDHHLIKACMIFRYLQTKNYMQQLAGYISRGSSIYKGKIYPQNQNHPQHTLLTVKKIEKKKKKHTQED